MTLDVQTLNQALLAGCGVLLVAILAVRGSVRVGLPSLLLYLLIGVGLGDAGLGVTLLAPARDALGGGVLDGAGAGDLAPAVVVGKLGARRHRGDRGAREAELPARLHGHARPSRTP